jgi:hypothetical protein
MNEINLKMKTVNVETKTRKVKCDWSVELVKDLNSFHNLDVEAELEKLLANELKIATRKENRKKKIENLTKHTCLF